MKIVTRREAREFVLRQFAGKTYKMVEETYEDYRWTDDDGNERSESNFLGRRKSIPRGLRFYFTEQSVDERVMRQKLWAKDARGLTYVCRCFHDSGRYGGPVYNSGLEMVLIGERELISAKIADDAAVEEFLSSSLRECSEDTGDDAGLWREYSDVRYAVDLKKRVSLLETREHQWYECDVNTGKYEIKRDDITSPRKEERYEDEYDEEEFSEDALNFRMECEQRDFEFNRAAGWGDRFRYCGDVKHANYFNLLFKAEKGGVDLKPEGIRDFAKMDCWDLISYCRLADNAYVSVWLGPLLKISFDINPDCRDCKITLRKVEWPGMRMEMLTRGDFAAMIDRLYSEARLAREQSRM